MKENKCKVCSLFNERNFNEEIKFNINKLIKSKKPTEVLNKETGFDLTDYRYKLHRQQCLIDFEFPIEEQKIENEEDKKFINEDIYVNILKTSEKIEKFRSWNLKQKEDYISNILKEINFLILDNIHYQLINGRIDIPNFKCIVPKDDISSLKIINDIMKNNEEDVNDKNEYIQRTRLEALEFATKMKEARGNLKEYKEFLDCKIKS